MSMSVAFLDQVNCQRLHQVFIVDVKLVVFVVDLKCILWKQIFIRVDCEEYIKLSTLTVSHDGAEFVMRVAVS